MNDLLLTLRERGKKKGYTFDEKLLKEENVRVNIELQNFIKYNVVRCCAYTQYVV